MSAELDQAVDERYEDYLQYRALSTTAVASLICSLLSPVALLGWIWIWVPIAGLLLAILALRKIRSRADELSGAGIAKAGLALSVLFLFAGPACVSYEYTHEVPEGHDRISYDELQPEINVPQQQIPPAALELDGKRVFIKGFVYPGSKKENIKTFLLVRDQGDCCFGGNPKITDRIQVTLNDPLRLQWDKRLHGVAGVFRVKPSNAAVDGVGGIYYQLEADYLH
ncbi:MAG TPA: DUF3299 domain-containing protein [Pirellulales bacterium]|nr:DUF3299 domain-containing protein [Pirellulales bacterium]